MTYPERKRNISLNSETTFIFSNGVLLVVVHTFRETNDLDVSIRIISARKATRKEIKQYEEFNP